jgi:hypothetical protein
MARVHLHEINPGHEARIQTAIRFILIRQVDIKDSARHGGDL